MSGRSVQRALARLASAPDAALLPDRNNTFALFPGGDRRRRPLARLTGDAARRLESSGALCRHGEVLRITAAGRALAARSDAAPDERFLAQHAPIIDRAIVVADGAITKARGCDPDAVLRRLAALRDGKGATWLSAAEIAAAARLRNVWQRGEQGLLRGSDWSAPATGGAARGPGNAREGALAAHCDARRMVTDMLDRLAPALRRVVERVCLREDGLEALERAESWPARSGKLALKLALAQLAAG